MVLPPLKLTPLLHSREAPRSSDNSSDFYHSAADTLWLMNTGNEKLIKPRGNESLIKIKKKKTPPVILQISGGRME